MTSDIENGNVGITILGSGSSGNATVIHCGTEAIMIDAGFSFKETSRRLKLAGISDLNINGILVTHEHSDHIGGIRLCSEKFEAPVYATRQCGMYIRNKNPRIGQMASIAAGCEFSIGRFEICPFSIPHDACDPVAYTIRCGNVKIGVATDIGYASSGISYQLSGCGILVLESNHDINMLAASNRPWQLKQRILSRQGHLSNEASSELLENIISPQTRSVILAHLSQECNTAQQAYNVARSMLAKIGRTDIRLLVADQNIPMETVWYR